MVKAVVKYNRKMQFLERMLLWHDLEGTRWRKEDAADDRNVICQPARPSRKMDIP
jgi:hypothetical protein